MIYLLLMYLKLAGGHTFSVLIPPNGVHTLAGWDVNLSNVDYFADVHIPGTSK